LWLLRLIPETALVQQLRYLMFGRLEFGGGIEQVVSVYGIPISALRIAQSCDVDGFDRL
jgi:hypothetical protein